MKKGYQERNLTDQQAVYHMNRVSKKGETEKHEDSIQKYRNSSFCSENMNKKIVTERQDLKQGYFEKISLRHDKCQKMQIFSLTESLKNSITKEKNLKKRTNFP